MAGAWAMDNAVLRASRHVAMHGAFGQRFLSGVMVEMASPLVTEWAADPRVDPPLLRRALDDLRAIAAMSPPNSETLKIQYLVVMKELDRFDPRRESLRSISDQPAESIYDVPGLLPAAWFLLREPERSRRVTRLVFANWLSECDLLAETSRAPGRPPIPLYAVGPRAPRPARALPPGEIESWLESTILARHILFPLGALYGDLERDRALLGGMQLTIAERLYELANGKPPKTLDLLVGPYLDKLPEGYEAADALPSTRPPERPR
jgi:hypothetical protein